jgi:hypothetical protein
MTYTDFNGVERTEDFYFHLTEAEIMEMEIGTAGGLAEMIKRVVDAKDFPTILKTFKDVVLKAYGIKSPDGRRFEKSEQIAAEFAQTNAYSKLFVELATDDKAAAEFVNGIIPHDTKSAAH